ncbi:MAG: hypothetical protein WBQ60_09800 [Asticcacaulis sp.]
MSDKATDTPHPAPKPAGGRSQAEAKAARLKAALRENLRRRKAAGSAAEVAPAPDDHEKATPSQS